MRHKRENRMKPCERCLEKNWRYEFNEGLVTATCQNCGSEVQFEARKKTGPPKENHPVSLAHRYVPWIPESDRTGKLPWD